MTKKNFLDISVDMHVYYGFVSRQSVLYNCPNFL